MAKIRMSGARSRTYIPEWGAFTGPDWKIDITETLGQGSYFFPHNNPLVYRDPSGLNKELINEFLGKHNVNYPESHMEDGKLVWDVSPNQAFSEHLRILKLRTDLEQVASVLELEALAFPESEEKITRHREIQALQRELAWFHDLWRRTYTEQHFAFKKWKRENPNQWQMALNAKSQLKNPMFQLAFIYSFNAFAVGVCWSSGFGLDKT